MHFTIHHDNLNIKGTFVKYIEDVLREKFHQYFSHLSDEKVQVSVNFHKNNNNEIENKIVMRAKKNHLVIRGDASSDSASQAFEMSVVKISKKMSKYKDKFEDYIHHYGKHKNSIKIIKKKTALLNSFSDKNDFEEFEKNEQEVDAPVEILSKEQAVMKMDIGGFGALCYIDVDTNSVNFVYRREDGMISFINSAELK